MIKKFKNSNKKGGIELSLNLIIMLIIGMTVLALVIGFVTKMIGDSADQFSNELSKAESAEKERLVDAPGIFAAGPSDLVVSAGSSKKFFMKIYNPTDAEITIPAITKANIKDGAISNAKLVITGANVDLASGCTLTALTSTITVQPRATEVFIGSIEAGKQCNPGESFIMTLQFIPETGVSKSSSISGTIS